MSSIDRFMAKVLAVPIAGCWLWDGAVQKDTGYGRFGMPGNTVDYAHRAAWRLFCGDIPAGLCVCHRCDIRLCVNPHHLFIGTREDNMQDASRKRRIVVPVETFASDETHQVAVLTNEQVIEIRGSDERSAVLAERLGVTRGSIWKARTRRTFKDVVCQ